jgi:hypothetical protein
MDKSDEHEVGAGMARTVSVSTDDGSESVRIFAELPFETWLSGGQ